MSGHVFRIATQEPSKFLAAISEGLGADHRIAKQIREQMPKPKPEEPSGDCVVVVEGHWPPFHKTGDLWSDQDGYQFDTWDAFTDYFPRSEFVIYQPETTSTEASR